MDERVNALEAALGELWHDALKGKPISDELSERIRGLLTDRGTSATFAPVGWLRGRYAFTVKEPLHAPFRATAVRVFRRIESA